jgi:hypothetical protein
MENVRAKRPNRNVRNEKHNKKNKNHNGYYHQQIRSSRRKICIRNER